MNATPTWIIRTTPPDPRMQEEPKQPDPPKPEPSFGERVGNFFTKTIPGWVRSAADWAKYKWDELKSFLKIGGRNTSIEGVDKRLLHIACAMGMANHAGCTCTDGMRSKNATYGAPNSQHKVGNALDISLSSFPSNVRGVKVQEQYVADIAAVLGYGHKDPHKTLWASRHDVGGGDHMHFQFGYEAISRLNRTAAGTDIGAAERRLLKYITPEKLAQIKSTKMPDEISEGRAPATYSRYENTQQRPEGPRLVYAQPRPDHGAPKPAARTSTEEPIRRWYITPPAN